MKREQQFALFLDKKGKVIKAKIERLTEEPISDKSQIFININCIQSGGELVSYLRLYTVPYASEKLVLDMIYEYSKFRGQGIGKKMFELLPDAVKDLHKTKLVGAYLPNNYAEDCASGIEFNEKDANVTANFYKRNGFQLIRAKNIWSNKNIGLQDFEFGGLSANTIVYLPLPLKQNKYINYNGFLLHKDDEYKLKENLNKTSACTQEFEL